MTKHEISLKKFKNKQKFIKKSRKIGKKKLDEIFGSNRVSLKPMSDFFSLKSLCDFPTLIEPRPYLSPIVAAFANRYRRLKSWIHRRGFKLRRRANFTKMK